MHKWYLLMLAGMLAACSKTELKRTHFSFYSHELLEGDTLYCVPVTEYYPGFALSEEGIWAIVDSANTVFFDLLLDAPAHYQIVRQKNKFHVLTYDMYLEPGDSVVIHSSLNEDLYPVLEISGRGVDKYKPIIDDCNLFPINFEYFNYIRQDHFPEIEDFKSYVDSVQGARIHHLIEHYGLEHLVNQGLYAKLWSTRAEHLLAHLSRRNAIMDVSYDYYYPPSSYLQFLDSIPAIDSFAHFTAFKLLAPVYLENQVRMPQVHKPQDHIYDSLQQFTFEYIESLNPSVLRDVLTLSVTRKLSSYLSYSYFSRALIDFNNKFLISYIHQPYADYFFKQVDRYLDLGVGKPLPKLSLPNIEGKIQSVYDFSDSILFIDFWGTWCGPCIQNIPKVLNLMAKYEEEPVKFLFIALEYSDEEIERWKQFVRGGGNKQVPQLPKTGFPGEHWVARGQFQNPALEPYAIHFVPTYMLADQNHNIMISRTFDFDLIEQQIDSLLINMKIENPIIP